MEFVLVTFPELRTVQMEGLELGTTGQVLPVERGTHIFDSRQSSELPASQRRNRRHWHVPDAAARDRVSARVGYCACRGPTTGGRAGSPRPLT